MLGISKGRIILNILSVENWEFSRVFSRDYLIILRYSPLAGFLLPKLFYNSVEAEFNLYKTESGASDSFPKHYTEFCLVEIQLNTTL